METQNLDDQGFKRIENDAYKVILFPIQKAISGNDHSHAELIYNAKVTHKATKFVLSFAVRRLEDGAIIAGSSSKMNGYRGIIDEFKGGRSFEKLSIPKEAYTEIMNLIAKA